MKILTEAITRETSMKRILAAVDAGACPALLSGTGALSRAHAAAALRQATGRPLVAVCPDEGEARRFAADVSSFLGEEARLLSGRDLVFYNAEGVSRQGERARIAELWSLARGSTGILAVTPDALMLRTLPKDTLLALTAELKSGGRYDLGAVTALLVRAGYERAEAVEGAGQFAVRGGILDFFSPGAPDPVRCEFWGDEIDSMGYFDTATQRRAENVAAAVILPARETPPSAAAGGEDALAERMEGYLRRLSRRKNVKAELTQNVAADIARVRERRSLPSSDRYLDLLYPEATAADYLPPDALVVFCEPPRIAERAKNWLWQLGEDTTALLEAGVWEGGPARVADTWERTAEKLADFPVVMLASFTTANLPYPPKTLETLQVKQLPSYGGSLETAAGDISHYVREGYSVAVLCGDKRRAGVLQERLTASGVDAVFDYALEALPEKGRCTIALGALSAGLEYPETRLAIVTEGQLTGELFRRKNRKKLPKNASKLESFTDLSPGDLVVHATYGIGRFEGVVKRRVDGADKDYIKLAYSGTDVLYIPATQLDMVAKYIGAAEDSPVKLSKLGGGDWARAKSRAKGAVKELADGLLKLQAERRTASGHPFPEDSEWQKEFEESFEYQETDDQLRAAEEIKKDMESPVPMDRLLCGDVGYGKTEVALRAVMKCVLDGYQAAILVPTTVLAQQHYATASRRFAGYPVKIEVLSRLRSPAQTRDALRGAADGSVDILIGTHKLLQKDVKFRRLGLLVVDEEQRFGVQHKERLKELSRQVDVLTLSATPIPRTLNMALSGVRDMSTIEEPPFDRQPVQTYVLEYDEGIVLDAVRRELSRGGQVYFLHNRVENIERTASRLAAALPGASVAVAHGQMDDDALNAVMERTAAGDVQVLVCTTIIETGIDIPNVNTLIIEDADRLGLAQLHQIRGRVGRSSRRAYAYFTFRRDKVLSEVAEKRLSAIREFAEFNSGFKIAMRDLEIRGAGNILGAEQSGHLMSVGYDMYLKLLDEAVHEAKGEKLPERPDCSADLAVSANIPEAYVASADQRMDLYRRIALIRTEADADDMTDELIDRFGDPPKEVNALIHIALLRGEAADTGISDISQKDGRLLFGLSDFEMDRISRLYALKPYAGRIRIEAGMKPSVSLRLRPGERVLEAAVGFVRDYKGTGAAPQA